MIPYLTHDLDEMWISALEKAREHFNVSPEDQDLFQWLDDAIETKELKFKPGERKTRAKSINILAKRLYKHICAQQSPTPHEIIREASFRMSDDKTGGSVFKLTEPEREALKEARAAGPNKDDQLVALALTRAEDWEFDWIDSAIETGEMDLVADKKARRKVTRSMRVVADRVRNDEAQEKRYEERKIARSLNNLAEEVAAKSLILETDLRAVSRESDRCQTTVYVHEDNHPHASRQKWIVAGQGKLRLDMNPPELQVYLPAGVTDFEHDSGYALRMPLIGIEFEGIQYHTTIVSAYVAPRSLDDFAVPWPGYNPMEHPDTIMCGEGDTGYDECKQNPHPMVPEGFYTPYNDADLYHEVEGRMVTIHFAVVRPDDDDGSV